MNTDDELLQRAQTPPLPSRPHQLPPPPDPTYGPIFWPAVIAAGVAGDLVLRVGYQTLAGSLAVMAVIAVTISQRIGRLRPLDQAALALASALAASLALRTSDWVTFPALIAAASLTFLVGTNRLAGGSRPWVSGLFHGVGSCVTMVRWVGSTAERIGRGAGHSAVAVLRATLLAGSLGLVMVTLLASGDAVTASLLAATRFGSVFAHTIGFTFAVVVALAVGFVSLLSKPATSQTEMPAGIFLLEARAIVATIVGILGTWSAVQISVALGAADKIISTEGLTVAEYAREGFFQLVTVAAIVLTAITIASRVSGLPALPEGRSFRFGSAIVGAELLVLIGSSFLRLGYYINEFGLTMLRLSVAWFLAWLSFFSIVIIARATGSTWAQRWSHTISVVSLGVAVLAFAVLNPEAIVVNRNLSMDQVDVGYLTDRLAGDGKKAIQSSDYALTEDLVRFVCDDLSSHGYGVLSWNHGRPDC